MTPEVQIAAISLLGSAIVGVVSYFANRKGAEVGAQKNFEMVDYRLRKLEEQVGKHNQIVERTFDLEGRMREAEHDIRDLKGVQ